MDELELKKLARNLIAMAAELKRVAAQASPSVAAAAHVAPVAAVPSTSAKPASDTPTPRTDERVNIEVHYGINNKCETETVSADFARQLERELADSVKLLGQANVDRSIFLLERDEARRENERLTIQSERYRKIAAAAFKHSCEVTVLTDEEIDEGISLVEHLRRSVAKQIERAEAAAAIIAKLRGDVGDALIHLARVLPMAKAHAAAYPVGINQELCNDANALIDAARLAAKGE